MNGMLPPNLRVPASGDADFKELLERIIEQNDEILERLDDGLIEWAKAPIQETVVTGAAVFWEAAFSIWGLLIVVIICAMLTQIFSGTPLFN